MSQIKHYEIKYQHNDANFAVIKLENNEVVRTGKTMQDAINIMNNLEANMPATELGFGEWGIPAFLLKKAS